MFYKYFSKEKEEKETGKRKEEREKKKAKRGKTIHNAKNYFPPFCPCTATQPVWPQTRTSPTDDYK